MFVDSHCHLDCIDLEPFNGSFDELMRRAAEAQVQHMLCVNVDLEHHDRVKQLAQRYTQISCSLGVHPCYEEVQEPDQEQLIQLGSAEEVVAIGETGLDYLMGKEDYGWQQERFRRHVRAAREVKKPLIIHTRGARQDTVQILRDESADEIGGVMHCFAEDLATAQQAMELNFYISISGIITFKKADELREVVKQIPLNRLLIETDSPWLAPVPHRGKTNHPAWVAQIAQTIADLHQVSIESVAKHTTENFERLFRVQTSH